MKKLFILLLSVVCMAMYAKEEKTFQSMDHAANKSHEMLKEQIKKGKGGVSDISGELKKQDKITQKEKENLTYIYDIISTTKVENDVADDRKNNKQNKQAYTYKGNLTIKSSQTKFKYVVNGDFSIKIPTGKNKGYKAVEIKLDKSKRTLVPYFESEAQKKTTELVQEYYKQHKDFVDVKYLKVEPCEEGYKVTTTRTYKKDKYTGNKGTVKFFVQKDKNKLDDFKLLLDKTEEEGFTDYDNTPAPKEPTPVETDTIVIEDNRNNQEKLEQISINTFKLNSVSLSDENKEQLDQVAQLLLTDKDIEIWLFGHSCNLGDGETNYNFGLMRAKEAKKYLISKGVEQQRIHVDSYGEKNPLLPNTTEENRAQNRRVEIKLIK